MAMSFGFSATSTAVELRLGDPRHLCLLREHARAPREDLSTIDHRRFPDLCFEDDSPSLATDVIPIILEAAVVLAITQGSHSSVRRLEGAVLAT